MIKNNLDKIYQSRLQSDKQMLSNNLERIEREICSNAKVYILYTHVTLVLIKIILLTEM